MEMWNGCNKAFTLSYDDGVETDRRLAEMLNYYGLKCTFNLNSGCIGSPDTWKNKDFTVRRLPIDTLPEIYKGHEIAVHGKFHKVPTELSDEELEDEFVNDRKRLTEIFGQEPIGMAYAYGAFDDRVVEYLRSIGLKYARTVWDADNFDVQKDLMRLRPTCHHNNERLFDLIDEFLSIETDQPQLFYLWGHTYEFGGDDNWDRIEAVCKKVSGRSDIFFGTNKEVFGL